MATVLVPVDFDGCCERVLDVAARLARDLGAELVLLHVLPLAVFPFPEFPPPLVTKMGEEASRDSREALERLAARVGGTAMLREGDPSTGILHAIEQLDPRMVVMGTHSRASMKRIVLGSVAKDVSRRSPVPVVIVSNAGVAPVAGATAKASNG